MTFTFKNPKTPIIHIFAFILIISILIPNINSLSSKNNQFPSLIQNEYIKDYSQNSKFDEPSNNDECDILTQGPICLFNGDRVLLSYNSQKGLIGYWNFDEIKPYDLSGRKNHGNGIVQAGPSFGGYGTSGLFKNGNFLTVYNTQDFNSNSFTITFWLFTVDDYFSNDKGTRYCPFIQKGNDDIKEQKYERAPAIYFDREERNLLIYVQREGSNDEGKFITSRAKIPSQKWLHIAVIKNNDNMLSLYINGIFDNSTLLKGEIEFNDSPLYIGNVPWLKDECVSPFLIDELRYYNTAIEVDYIQAEASPVLGGISPNFLHIGCIDCSLDEAEQSCNEGYQLCSSLELHSGGFQIARGLGLLSWDTHIWALSALENEADYSDLKGLGLCCLIL